MSQAPVAGLVAMVSAMASKYWGLDPALAIALGLGVGAACGFTNGVLAARFHLHPIVMTLATSSVFLSLTYLLTTCQAVVGLLESFFWLGQGQLGVLPVPVLVMVLVTLAMHLLLTRTFFGLRVLMIGGNFQAATDIGINVEGVRIGIFSISGLLAALGGIVLLG